MFYVKGKIKRIHKVEYKKSDGTSGHVKNVYVEPDGEIYPILVKVADVNKDVGKEGEQTELRVRIFPYAFVTDDNGKTIRKRAFFDVYLPRETK